MRVDTQRLGFAVVASTQRPVEEVITTVDDYIWSHPEIEVLPAERSWLEIDS